MRYSLANYYLSIDNANEKVKALFGDVRIGGEGDAVSSISVSTSNNLWDTQGYATGAWVHNKNLSRVGTAEISLSQLTDAVAKFKTFVNYFYLASDENDVQGSTLTLTDSSGKIICTCYDCYPVKVPAQEFGATAAEQRWSFTCGKVVYAD